MKRRTALQTISLGTGVALSGFAFSSFLASCKTEAVDLWKPSFLSIEDSELVESIVDFILPKTDSSPGAKELGIIQTIDNVLNKLYKKKDQEEFTKGILLLTNQIRAKEGEEIQDSDIQNFIQKKLSFESEDELKRFNELAKMEIDENSENPETILSAKALYNIKSLGINAYFRNPTIATEYLNYDPVPGVYNGCIPVKDVGNVWSL